MPGHYRPSQAPKPPKPPKRKPPKPPKRKPPKSPKMVAKAKKKDPEAPYSDNPTPGKPGWNLAKAKRKKAYKQTKKA
jgi:hypothetical protein